MPSSVVVTFSDLLRHRDPQRNYLARHIGDRLQEISLSSPPATKAPTAINAAIGGITPGDAGQIKFKGKGKGKAKDDGCFSLHARDATVASDEPLMALRERLYEIAESVANEQAVLSSYANVLVPALVSLDAKNASLHPISMRHDSSSGDSDSANNIF
ncbi:hypothetical protein EV182_007225, partial [Spiromyces aspiralis]